MLRIALLACLIVAVLGTFPLFDFTNSKCPKTTSCGPIVDRVCPVKTYDKCGCNLVCVRGFGESCSNSYDVCWTGLKCRRGKCARDFAYRKYMKTLVKWIEDKQISPTKQPDGDGEGSGMGN